MKRKTSLAANQTPAPAARLTDPHLAALLLYIANEDSDDRDGRAATKFAMAQSAARRLLASEPITSAFALWIDRPELQAEVSACVGASIEHWTDPEDSRRTFGVLHAALTEDRDGAESVDDRDLKDVMPAFIDHAVLVGACLMYELLKGGGR